MLIRYLKDLTTGRLVLWCYFIWYCVVLVRYFDSRPRLWLTSLGIAAIVGTGLYLSTTAADKNNVRLGFWKIARLYMMPFFVSSFSALVKDRGFILIFSPNPVEILIALGGCAALCLAVWLLKRGVA